MKKSFFLLMTVLVLGLGLTGAALAICTDVVNSGTGFNDYRESYEDFSWTHNGVCPVGVKSANLSIYALDVDSSSGEVDLISAYDTTTFSWVNLGQLFGTSLNWSTTTFTLPSSLYDEAQSGLQVKIDIDSTNTNNTMRWAVEVGSSTLEAQCVPLPGTLMLLSSGLLGLAGWRRLRKG